MAKKLLTNDQKFAQLDSINRLLCREIHKLKTELVCQSVLSGHTYQIFQAWCCSLQDHVELLVRAALLTDDPQLKQAIQKSLDRKNKAIKARAAFAEAQREHLQKNLEKLESINPTLAALISSMRDKRDVPRDFL